MVSRREFFGMTLGAGAALALTPAVLRAFEQSGESGEKLIQRAVPSSGEMLPVIGLQFRNSTAQDPAALKEVLKTLVDHGGRFLDTMHQSMPGVEDLTARVVTELGIQDKLFLGLRANPPGPGAYIDGPPAADIAKAQIDALFDRFKVQKLDLVQVGAHGDPTQLPVLLEAKKAGRIRYVGVTTIVDQSFPQMEAIMRNEPIDFIGVHYCIDKRNAAETILPLAQERKIGVIAYFPFGVGTLFKRVGAKPLPKWAEEFDAKTWAQFFLKYVISHPAVTMVRAGTTNPQHMLDNIGGGIGRLPDQAMRKRMQQFVDALPKPPPPKGPPPPDPKGKGIISISADVFDRYVGEYKTEAGTVLTFRRDGMKLLVRPGYNAEVPLMPRTQTRFADPRGPFIEFQLDTAGKVTGLVVEQGAQKTPASRVR
jgi:aryl-alcohol dehydrogenase-like predicted oxidoreductase